MQGKTILITMAALALAGCEKAEAPAPADAQKAPASTIADGADSASATPAEAAHRFASWAGKWTGVEGMYVTITPAEPGKYRLEMQSDLDTKGDYEGTDGEHGIGFERGGEQLSLRRGSGDETGLKYLAGKTECLVVKAGEGYCRD
ncbi:MAG: hypothetical protein U0S50_05045 [Sphingopyxis sp.]|uniref:hypothetical protein n=1 Tax=Sphingopyxis sp. TaxID=1908224 RepID=UPI002AB91C7B|nr:hypothetical protein [Sphingopyxis sp.]MDZ3831169.1 hypothetical protein [Sphingopyxis sp.]